MIKIRFIILRILNTIQYNTHNKYRKKITALIYFNVSTNVDRFLRVINRTYLTYIYKSYNKIFIKKEGLEHPL